MPTLKTLFLADIALEDSPKVRAEIRDETVQEYAALDKTTLPAPVVFLKNGLKHYLLADGRHRIEAARTKKEKQIPCEVRAGDYGDCLRFAVQANTTHGLRRSNADKRVCAESILSQWPEKTDRELADIGGLSHNFVREVRAFLLSAPTEKIDSVHPDRPKTLAKSQEKSEKNIGCQNQLGENLSTSNTSKRDDAPKKPEKPPSVLDATGFTIPAEALVCWNRRQEIQDLMTAISRVKCAVAEAKEKADPLFGKISNGCIAELNQAYTHLSFGLPYAVCTQCQGVPWLQKHGCSMCGNAGVISKHTWDTCTPKEIKAMRAKQSHSA